MTSWRVFRPFRGPRDFPYRPCVCVPREGGIEMAREQPTALRFKGLCKITCTHLQFVKSTPITASPCQTRRSHTTLKSKNNLAVKV